MAWDDAMVGTLRVLVNDPDALTYSDQSLRQALLAAAKMVPHEVTIAVTYTADIDNETLTPDPTVEATRDDAFANLVTLKAACITDRGAATLAAKQGIFVKDGDSAIDLRGAMQGRLALLKAGGWCQAYEQAKKDFLSGGGSFGMGAAVMTPFRVYPQGGYSSVGY